MLMTEKFNAVLAALRVGAVIIVGSWTVAQGAVVSGSIKDLSTNQGIQEVIIAIKDVSTGRLAGIGITNVLGNYSVTIPAQRNYTLEASKLGYANVTAPAVVELSDRTPNRTVNIPMRSNKPAAPALDLSWKTEARKSYLIPALEIPAFLLILNGVDRILYPDLMAGGKKVYSTNLSTFRDHLLHGPWVIDRDAFSMNQFGHPY